MRKLKKSRRVRRAGRGSVIVIALLLMSSGVLRITSGVAFAKDSDQISEPLDTVAQTGETTLPGNQQAKENHSPDRAKMGGLLEALRAREDRLKENERQIALRTEAINIADEEITKRLAALEQAEAALRSTLSLADGAAEDDLARLTVVYESMKPKDAAALFEAMEPGFAAGFLGRMRPDVAAAVMTNLSPEAAYSISVILAGRHARVPKT